MGHPGREHVHHELVMDVDLRPRRLPQSRVDQPRPLRADQPGPRLAAARLVARHDPGLHRRLALQMLEQSREQVATITSVSNSAVSDTARPFSWAGPHTPIL
jgi:hypothetical protein